ncbi:MAG TPA: efflux RND transporter periplasmic adaptor subunit [Vicinamibacterales bacterium]|nr:efflux RND transporter periplasmic adaptor subunit [Vicinamibacterales bacterium]
MRSRNPVLLLLLVSLSTALGSACRRGAPPEPAEPPSIAVTVWSDRTELFMEHPPLVAGDTARFAIHVTDLSDFSPVREGRLVLRFQGETIERFEVDAPSTPGLFIVGARVPAARRYQLAVEIHAPGFTDEHLIGTVTVHPTLEEAVAAIEENEEGATTFLKEQQWTLDFATARVDDHVRREVTVVPATIEPRAGGSAEVRATTAGRLTRGGDRALGTPVGRGEVLAEIVVRNDRIGEGPVLRLELANAQTELRLAEQSLSRVERLAAAGAVPARRLDEARAARDSAATRVRIAREELRHNELSRSGAGAGESGERVVIRAPIAGVIAEAPAGVGETVEAGALLYRIVAVDRVHVVGAIPERHLASAQGVLEAEIDAPGVGPVRTTRLVSLGRVVDPATRSVSIVFALDRMPAALAVGQSVSLRLIGRGAPGIAVPATAVVDDAGQPIVFVQAGGESFERRPVRVGGPREGGYVQILSGLDAGDRIVIRGAHLVRLAALSPQTPGHGHVH